MKTSHLRQERHTKTSSHTSNLTSRTMQIASGPDEFWKISIRPRPLVQPARTAGSETPFIRNVRVRRTLRHKLRSRVIFLINEASMWVSVTHRAAAGTFFGFSLDKTDVHTDDGDQSGAEGTCPCATQRPY